MKMYFQEKESFAVDWFKDRIVKGSFENGEYYSFKNVLVREKNRKDRGIRLEKKVPKLDTI